MITNYGWTTRHTAPARARWPAQFKADPTNRVNDGRGPRHRPAEEVNAVFVIPPHEPPRHSIASPLRLIDEVRQIAFDASLAADDALRRIRDAFNAHNEVSS
jgi:hypothetical protein